jgi:hypothetical protein
MSGRTPLSSKNIEDFESEQHGLRNIAITLIIGLTSVNRLVTTVTRFGHRSRTDKPIIALCICNGGGRLESIRLCTLMDANMR